jgi:hypothetical protein
MRGRGGVVEDVIFENIRMQGLRGEAIVMNMFYESSTVVPKSDAPPLFRNITIRDVACDGAGVAVHIRGLPERHIEGVVLERLRLKAVKGILCEDVDHLTLNDVTGLVKQEPLLHCSDVRELNIADMTLEQVN